MILKHFVFKSHVFTCLTVSSFKSLRTRAVVAASHVNTRPVVLTRVLQARVTISPKHTARQLNDFIPVFKGSFNFICDQIIKNQRKSHESENTDDTIKNTDDHMSQRKETKNEDQ